MQWGCVLAFSFFGKRATIQKSSHKPIVCQQACSIPRMAILPSEPTDYKIEAKRLCHNSFSRLCHSLPEGYVTTLAMSTVISKGHVDQGHVDKSSPRRLPKATSDIPRGHVDSQRLHPTFPEAINNPQRWHQQICSSQRQLLLSLIYL